MIISKLIEVLQGKLDEVGDVEVLVCGGTRVYHEANNVIVHMEDGIENVVVTP